MKPVNKTISKQQIIGFLMKVYPWVSDKSMKEEIKKFVMKLRESD